MELTETQKGRKRWMLACFATQSEVLKYFPIDREKFRVGSTLRLHSATPRRPLVLRATGLGNHW